MKAVIRATFEAMDFNRQEKTWMVQLHSEQMESQPESRRGIPPRLAERLHYRHKIPIKDLQDIYDQAFAAKLIPMHVPAAQVMDYSLIDEVYKEKR